MTKQKPISDAERKAIADKLAEMVGHSPSPKLQKGAEIAPAPAPVVPELHEWEVRGAFRESGKDAVLTISAPTQAAAEHEASLNGMLVESCWPARGMASSTSSRPLGGAPPPQTIPYAGPSPRGTVPFAPPVLIERTSKQYKWQMLAGFLVSVFGIFSGCLFAPLAAAIRPQFGVMMLVVGGMCFIGGLIWAMVARFGAWWHHG